MGAASKRVEKPLVVFDFDGVLSDSYERYLAAHRRAFGKFGLHLSERRYRSWFLGNVRKNRGRYLASYPNGPEVDSQVAVEIRRETARVRLFPFAARLCRALAQGNRLAIITSLELPLLRGILGRSGRYFSAQVGSSHGKGSNLRALQKKFGVRRSLTTFVTDTVGDVVAVEGAAGIVLGVTWGYHSRAALRRTTARLVSSPRALALCLGVTLPT